MPENTMCESLRCRKCFSKDSLTKYTGSHSVRIHSIFFFQSIINCVLKVHKVYGNIAACERRLASEAARPVSILQRNAESSAGVIACPRAAALLAALAGDGRGALPPFVAHGRWG